MQKALTNEGRHYLLQLNEQVHDREALQYINSACVEMDVVTSLTSAQNTIADYSHPFSPSLIQEFFLHKRISNVPEYNESHFLITYSVYASLHTSFAGAECSGALPSNRGQYSFYFTLHYSTLALLHCT